MPNVITAGAQEDIMDQRALHVSRLRQSLDRIPEFQEGTLNAFSPDFKNWRDRTAQSLEVVFGRKHSYWVRFSFLSFWLARVSVGPHPAAWTSQDQMKFERDLDAAQRVIVDALEEVEFLPAEQKSTDPPARQGDPPIVVNINNILSQTVTVDLGEILTSLEALRLPAKTKHRAEELATELATESAGEQRWPVLAKKLDALKGLGKGVYQRVALPLLLDMLKRQAGL